MDQPDAHAHLRSQVFAPSRGRNNRQSSHIIILGRAARAPTRSAKQPGAVHTCPRASGQLYIAMGGARAPRWCRARCDPRGATPRVHFTMGGCSCEAHSICGRGGSKRTTGARFTFPLLRNHDLSTSCEVNNWEAHGEAAARKELELSPASEAFWSRRL